MVKHAIKHEKKTKGHFTENSNIIMAQELEQIQRKLMLNPEQIPSKHDSASCFGTVDRPQERRKLVSNWL